MMANPDPAPRATAEQLIERLENYYAFECPLAHSRTASKWQQLKEAFAALTQALDAARQARDVFQAGPVVLHSGAAANWKIDCDALSDAEVATLAAMLLEVLPRFGSVEGVPRGGLRLADALRPFVTSGPLLIVDDVLTTGASMEQVRNGREAVGAVIFARSLPPSWVRPLFLHSAALQADRDRAEQVTTYTPDLVGLDD